MEPQKPSQTQFLGTLDPRDTTNEPVSIFDLSLSDEQLVKAVVRELDKDIEHWNQKPWELQKTDEDNISYLLGDQIDANLILPHQTPYVDNRLFSSVRAIIAYVTNQMAKPELIPSKNTDKARRVASQLSDALYQHALDHKVNVAFKLAFKNLIVRKRGVIKLRYDDDYGPYGDICTDNIDPADIVVDRYARYGKEPHRIYHRQRGTIESLLAKFPEKEAQIKDAFNIQRGVYTQMSRMVTYWECWFTYRDPQDSYKEKEGLCWFLPNKEVILGKMKNPNWIYKGSEKKQKLVNVVNYPLKPFVFFNYFNTGRSFFDETSLFDQAKKMQDLLNKRGRQIWENADYANPRILVNGKLFDQADADKFVNKNPKTIGLLNNMEADANISNAVMKIEAAMLPAYVVQTLYDARNEIDTMMGTPAQFRGEQMTTGKNPTFSQDLMIKNQAGALQDDLVRAVNESAVCYYQYLLHMMNVYMEDDYWILTKGTSGDYNAMMLNSDNIDTNVRVGVQVDSTLPLDKQSQRQAAMQLAQIPGRIDDLSLFEMMGLPDAEKLAERVQRYNIDRYTYMQSIEQKLFNAEADADITLLERGKQPEEREDYSEDYLNHFNAFITTNYFQSMLKPAQQQRIINFLHNVANKAATTEGLQSSMLNPAGIIDRPPIFPLPKRNIDYRIVGQLSPQDTANMAQSSGQMSIPVNQQQGANPGEQPAGNAPAEAVAAQNGGSNPRVQNLPLI